jgi:hypothetical protein
MRGKKRVKIAKVIYVVFDGAAKNIYKDDYYRFVRNFWGIAIFD